MFKLHLKRCILCIVVAGTVGFYHGWNSHKNVIDNPIGKFILTGKVW